jgi:nucleoside-diphosphate-sugar epimerase
MTLAPREDFIIAPDAPVLVTGATGFIGPAVVASLLRHGFRSVRAFARPSSDLTRFETLVGGLRDGAQVEVFRGNLVSRDDCITATKDVAVIFHLAMKGDKSFPDAYMNSVVTTRNLLEASLQHKTLRRFVNVSSFAVYSNTGKSRWRLLDESSPIELQGQRRGEAYCFAKQKQDKIVSEYGKKYGIPHVIVRPGSVYGPGKRAITGRVGIDSFGVFLHLGGSNQIPFTYVDNCADAIALAGLQAGVDGEVFNVVDDDLPTSRQFLRLYKKNVRRFRSIYVPHIVSYALCSLWERYSHWSQGQLPPAFNRSRWHAEWKKTRYSNENLKTKLNWTPNVPMAEGLSRYFQNCRDGQHA